MEATMEAFWPEKTTHAFAPGREPDRCKRCGCAEAEAVHGAPGTLTETELGDRVSALNDADCRYALQWLATCGSAHPDGQALLRALDAVKRRTERVAAVR